MRYTFIELNGYRRFALNEFEHFAMTITAALQLIIGTNGSGKSSLLEQLTPLAPDPTDFTKQGSKTLHLEHNHRQYVFRFTFSPKRECRFEVDGQELNDGGTVTVYNELVREHFGITPEIHRLLLGKERFSSMSPARRKEWFLKLCDTNYDYAIRVYNKAKEMLRDTTGALKLAKKTLVTESERLLGDVELAKLKSEVDSLHECLNELLEQRRPLEHDLFTLERQQEELDRVLMSLARNLQTLSTLLKDNPLSLTDYDELIAQAQETIVRTQALLEKASADFKRNDEKIRLLQKAEAQSIETLDGEIAQLSQQQRQLLESSLVPLGLVGAAQALPQFEGLKTTLGTLFAEIPDNSQRQYSSPQLQAAREQIAQLTQQRVVTAEQLTRNQAGLKHMETHRDHPDLECPRCAHRFSAQYQLAKHQALQEEQRVLCERLEKEIAPKLKELELYVQRCTEYGTSYRHYIALTGGVPLLKAYWQQNEALVRDNPRSGVHWLEAIHADLHKQVEIERLEKLLKDKRELAQSLKSIGSVDLQSLIQQNQQLEETLGGLTSTLQKASAERQLQVQERERMKQFLELRGKIQHVIKKKRELGQHTLETLRRDELNQLIRVLQSELAQRVEKLGSAAQQKGIVENLSKRIDLYSEQETAWGVLVKELSPTEGLIAEGLLGFIKNFIDQMNSLIRSIWSYSLVVESCEVVEGAVIDLDYRFPMRVQAQPTPVSDVSKGSSGMIEIVDMAFKLTAMQYLHLQDSALFLDELGAQMDSTHKAETVYIIKTLVEQQTFPQVFLISHDFHQYGALANCEITLLNNLNVAAPPGAAVNQHVVMR